MAVIMRSAVVVVVIVEVRARVCARVNWSEGVCGRFKRKTERDIEKLMHDTRREEVHLYRFFLVESRSS